jgi:FkbM family methyltransferase
MYSQYGEERILYNFFKNKINGFLVDVGAMDGITYSNSRFLIEKFNWNGILVEPHPEYVQKLKLLYLGNDNIIIKPYACLDKETTIDFYQYSDGVDACVSTISEDFKNRVIIAHGDKFKKNILKVETKTLKSIIENNKVDFLSIDCEGVDMEVLNSNDWNVSRPSLICVEHSMELDILYDFMNSINYREYDKTLGNTFFCEK